MHSFLLTRRGEQDYSQTYSWTIVIPLLRIRAKVPPQIYTQQLLRMDNGDTPFSLRPFLLPFSNASSDPNPAGCDTLSLIVHSVQHYAVVYITWYSYTCPHDPPQSDTLSLMVHSVQHHAVVYITWYSYTCPHDPPPQSDTPSLMVHSVQHHAVLYITWYSYTCPHQRLRVIRQELYSWLCCSVCRNSLKSQTFGEYTIKIAIKCTNIIHVAQMRSMFLAKNICRTLTLGTLC